MPEPIPNEPLLDGVVVVDLSRVLAGPFCTLVLAQLGARVIKVEVPPRGDDSRAYGPFVNGASMYYHAVNHDKESIALDLKQPGDAAVLEALLAKADVLVENYRPGTLERLGFSWERLHREHPRLIYAQVTGFGTTGPYAARPAYDIVAQAMGGLMSVTGTPDGPPVRVGVSIGDMIAGLYTCIGINGALLRRERTGQGARIDVSMMDCQVAIMESEVTSLLSAGREPRKLGTRHPNIAPFQAYRAKDGHIVIAAGNDAIYERLCGAIGRPELLRDPRFATNHDRLLHVAQLEPEIESALAARTVSEWEAILGAAGVACGAVQSVHDLAEDPQVAARKMILAYEDARAGKVHVAGAPIKVGGVEEPDPPRPAPELDADRAAILALAGLGEPASERAR